jgi:Protein of unknown function (DUF2796)
LKSSQRMHNPWKSDMKHCAFNRIAIAIALGLASHALSAAEPHVHGIGNLQLVLEGNRLTLELRLPAMDVVGFEHAPREAKHQESVNKAVALLKDSRQVLEPAAAAECVLATAEVASELLKAKDHDHDHDHEHDHDHAHGEVHADFEASYRFECRRPEALQHIKVTVFQRLPRLEKLEVESVTLAGQRRQRLVPGQDTIPLL